MERERERERERETRFKLRTERIGRERKMKDVFLVYSSHTLYTSQGQLHSHNTSQVKEENKKTRKRKRREKSIASVN